MKGNLFNSVMVKRPQRNVFDLSHDVKMSSKFGFLYPCMIIDCIPGDKIKISGESMNRLMPMSAPVMHEMDTTVDYWFIPKRILWPGWDAWIFSHPGAPAHPTCTLEAAGGVGTTVGSLADYLGLPVALGAEAEPVSAMAFAAYQAVINEFYRDQNLQASVDWVLNNGDNTARTDLFTLRKRAWQHDYFTSCLPFAQKSTPVDLPLGTVEWNPAGIDRTPGQAPVFREDTGAPASTGDIKGNLSVPDTEDVNSNPISWDPMGSLEVGATTISDLRRAFKLQEWRELAARVGTRIKEGLKGFFDVNSQDSRLDLPEFITSVKSKFNISEVLNTTGTDDAPQGSMAGHGIGYAKGRYGFYNIPEHGYVIAIQSTRPKTAYQQGIEKHWLKYQDPYEHFWSQFEHIGEQAVQNREIYAFQTPTLGDGTFGYIPRYAEYKFMNSRVAGDFKTSLNDWHLGRIFSSPPALNSAFISCTPQADRILAAGDEVDYILSHVRHHITMIRGMSKFGSPSF